MKSWKKVFSTQNPVRAEIVKAILEENDVPAVVVNKKDSMYHFGILEVRVNQDNLLRAIKIIEEDVTFEE